MASTRDVPYPLTRSLKPEVRSRRRTGPLAVIAMLTAFAIGAPPASAADGALASPAAPLRAPYVPKADDEVLQEVPAASNPKVSAMETLRKKLDDDPANFGIATELARAYIDFGRELGDAHYAGYAEAVIAPWISRKQPPVAALVLQAVILQYRHQFSDARRLLKEALQREPNDAQAWLTLATLEMVQGEYAAANEACARVARTGGFTLGLACSGNLRSYLGEARQATGLLALIEEKSPTQSSSFRAWVEGLLAEAHERLGNWTDAEAHYRKGLKYEPNDNFLLVAYADFLLDRNRPKEVLDLLANYTQSDTAFLRIALAQAALGSPDLQRYVWIMAARFEALTQRGSDYYGREQVRFALHLQHDPKRALDLAQRNWQMQKAPWDARVFLEAAQAANDPQSAVPVLAFLERTKLEDPIIEPLARDLRAKLGSAAGRTP